PQRRSVSSSPAVSFTKRREACCLPHIRPAPLWFASTGAPLFTGPTCPGTPGATKCPEPLCTDKVLPCSSWSPGPRQQVLPHLHRSYGLMRQSSPLLVPRWYPEHPVCAGCCQPLLGEGPSRRYLCASFPACLDPYPGTSCAAC